MLAGTRVSASGGACMMRWYCEFGREMQRAESAARALSCAGLSLPDKVAGPVRRGIFQDYDRSLNVAVYPRCELIPGLAADVDLAPAAVIERAGIEWELPAEVCRHWARALLKEAGAL